MYASNASGEWVIQRVDGNGFIIEKGTSIAIDYSDKAHISYFDGNNNNLKYATNLSGTWVTETVDSNGDIGIFSSIAIDYSGKAHISYFDGTNNNLKYATNLSGTWATETVDSSGDVFPINSIAIDMSQKVHIGYRLYDKCNFKYVTKNTINTPEDDDYDGDGIPDLVEETGCTDVYDADTDDDGILDGDEDWNNNGVVDHDETNPCDADTDGDGIQDGTETGVDVSVPDPDGPGPLLGTDTALFVPDLDPSTTTNPLKKDSDGDGFWDGTEDASHNGRVDEGETDPNAPESHAAGFANLSHGFNLISIHASGDLKDLLPIIGDSTEVEQVLALGTQTGAYETFVPSAADYPSFVLSGSEGLIVYALKDRQIIFNTLQCTSPSFVAGTNLIGISCPAEGYSAYQFLSDYSAEDVDTVSRYSPEKGAFETASIGPEGSPVGVDFAIVPGEGYGVVKGE